MKKVLRPISRLKKKRRHGFRKRMADRGGRSALRRRRRKGRKILIP